MIEKCPVCKKKIKGIGHTITGDGERSYPIWDCNCGVNPANHQEARQPTEKEKKEAIRKLIKKADFPSRAYDFIFTKEFDKEKLLPSVKNYIEDNKQNGLCLVGLAGIGKTVSIVYLMCYLLNNKEKYNRCVTPQYIGYTELYVLYKLYERGFHTKYNNKDEEDRYLTYRKSQHILFIDDIIAGWDMFDLINYRYNNNLITFLSSNLEFEEFKNNLGQASMRRIKADMNISFKQGIKNE